MHGLPSAPSGARSLSVLALAALAGACAPTPTTDATGVFGNREPVTGAPFALHGGLVEPLGADRVVVAEPGRDRVVIAAVDDAGAANWVERTVDLGATPGRMAVDGRLHVHVALPTTGEVVHVDPFAGEVVARRATCASPRGLAVDEGAERLFVACADGRFQAWPLEGEGPAAEVRLPDDLRDVVLDVGGGRVHVSRFRAVEVLSLDRATLDVVARWSPPARRDPATDRVFAPRVAWRLRAWPEGGYAVLHQRHQLDAVPSVPARPAPGGFVSGGYGAPPEATGTVGCAGGVVEAAVSVRRWPPEEPEPPAGVALPAASLGSVGLAVDFALRPAADISAGAHALVAGSGGVRAFTVSSTAPDALCARPEVTFLQVAGTAGGVAWNADARQPVFAVPERGRLLIGSAERPLPGGPADVGFQRFHEAQPSGLACASCHPGGGDDGHTWVFEGKGFRRTQPLDRGLADGPFHRDGEHADFAVLWDDAFVLRMGGGALPAAEIDAVFDYVEALDGTPWTDADPARVARGEAVWAAEGCGGCHGADGGGGPGLHDVGTGNAFVDTALLAPSLEGVAQRGPWFHDGCADTLAATVDGTCAADARHVVEGPRTRADLVAWLETR